MRAWQRSGELTPSCALLSAGEILAQALPHLERNIHPVVIISAFKRALEEALRIIESISIPVDPSNETEMLALIKTSIGTKFVSRWSDMMCKLALQAIRTVARDENGAKTVDIKRYAKVEKVPGGEIEDSVVLDGVMVNKDVTHPKMRRRIENPRIVLLDCPLEYKKGESQTNIEISNEADWNRILEIEEEQIKAMCERIIEFKPDLIFTEKGVSGAFLPFLLREGGTLTLPTICRPCPTLPPQGRPSHQCHPPRSQVGQQPHRPCVRSDHRQPRRRPPRIRRWNRVRSLPHRQARRRVRFLSLSLLPNPH